MGGLKNFLIGSIILALISIVHGLPVDDMEHIHAQLTPQVPEVIVTGNETSQESPSTNKPPSAQVDQNQQQASVAAPSKGPGEGPANPNEDQSSGQLNSSWVGFTNEPKVTVNLNVPKCPEITDVITASRNIMEALRKANGMRSGLEVMLNAASDSLSSVVGCINKLMSDFASLFTSGELAKILKGFMGMTQRPADHHDHVVILR